MTSTQAPVADLTIREACDYLGIGRTTLHRLIRTRKLATRPAARPADRPRLTGGRPITTLVTSASLAAFLDGRAA